MRVRSITRRLFALIAVSLGAIVASAESAAAGVVLNHNETVVRDN